MQICYNEACASKCSSLEKDLELCEKYGFEYIEIDVGMLREYLKTHKLEELKLWFDSHRLKPYSIAPIRMYQKLFSTQDIPQKNKEFMDTFMFALESAKAIGVKTLIIVPPMSEAGQYLGFKDKIIDDCTNALIKLSDMADGHEVRLAFEPVGIGSCAVRSIAVAKDILYIAYKKNLGLALDAYNLYLNGGCNDFSDVAALKKEEIFAVHFMNADDVPAEKRSQAARTFPDRGTAVDIKAFLAALRATGYDGMISVETFRPEYYEREPEWVISEAYKSMKAVL